MKHDIPLKTVNTTGRKWIYAAFIGGASAVAFALMMIGPFTVANDNTSAIGIAVVVVEALLLAAGLTWFTLLVTTRRGVSQKRG
tara:strand:+ start:8293 stop:8544 length:252 start_codon:yes stop_codon:yes gene_type:complete